MPYTLIVAILMLAGLIGGSLANKSRLPTVTGYILFGLVLGPSFLNLITTDIYNNLTFVNDLALGMLAVSIGAELHTQMFKRFGKNLSIISLGNSFSTALLVTLATWMLGMEFRFALILGVVSMTISPSGVVAVVKDKKAKGEMTQNLLGLVALDNLICIITFGIVVAFIQSAGASDTSGAAALMGALLDILLAAILGIVVGFIFSYFVQRQLDNDRSLVLLLALILLNTGLSNWLGYSPILTNIMTGVAITNLTNRKAWLASLLDRVELPIFIVFLTLAGAKLDLAIIPTVGLIGLGYIVARVIGRVFGTYLFASFTDMSSKVKKNLGFGLLPQAGIAIGLATIAERNVGGDPGVITGIVLTGVIFFEIFGPLLLEKAINNVGEGTV